MGTRGGETQDTENTGLTLLPPPERCVPYTIQRGGGVGALEASRDTETGQEASRAAPVLGAMAGQGTRVAMVERGAWAAMAERGAWVSMVDPGTQEAMAERGAWETMAGQGTREAMADRGAWVSMMDPETQEAMAERGAWEAMAGSPPPKFQKRNFLIPGGALEALSLGALGSRTEPAGALGSRTEPEGAL